MRESHRKALPFARWSWLARPSPTRVAQRFLLKPVPFSLKCASLRHRRNGRARPVFRLEDGTAEPERRSHRPRLYVDCIDRARREPRPPDWRTRTTDREQTKHDEQETQPIVYPVDSQTAANIGGSLIHEGKNQGIFSPRLGPRRTGKTPLAAGCCTFAGASGPSRLLRSPVQSRLPW